MIVTASDQGIEREISDHFKFQVPGYKFMPAYKNGMWDGFIRLYNKQTNTIYRGLFERVVEFAEKRGYQVEYEYSDFTETEFSVKDAEEFIESLNLPKSITPYDYQVEALISAARHKRQTILSPTGSGKSLMIYMIARYFDVKTLIIVPITTLVPQLAGDFKDYGYEHDVHMIHGGKTKDTDKKLSVTTWQSIYKMPRTWFAQFELVIVDETHHAKAKSITSILEKLSRCENRIGLTGTLDGNNVNQWVIEGLLGPVNRVAKTSELQDRDILAGLMIRCLILHYSEEEKKQVYGQSYHDELDFIISHQKRNEFIKKLVLSLKGNTLVLFQYVSKHGDILYDMISKATDRKVYYIHGGVDVDERNDVRAIIEKEDDSIIVASVQSFSTGINIKKLNNIVFTSPSKARIRTLQSIGRALRKMEGKTDAALYDIADNIVPKDKKKMNYTVLHFLKRLKIYQSEDFKYKIHNIRLHK